MICLSVTPVVSIDHIIGQVQKRKQSLRGKVHDLKLKEETGCIGKPGSRTVNSYVVTN